MRVVSVIGIGCLAVLAGCAGAVFSPQIPGPTRAPALDVLALDFERTVFDKSARVSGRVAQDQRAQRLSLPTRGRLRREATGPIPTEVLVEIDRLTTSGGRVTMSGRLVLRDLGLGTVLASLDDFSGSGPMPLVERGGGTDGLVFRGVEAEILSWISGLECDTRARTCGPPLAVPGVDGGASEDGDLELAAMVGRRPGGLRKLNSGGIDPNRVVAAAAPPPAPVAEAGVRKIGETVAALGLLDRSGFWLKTPLVSEEGPGEIVLKSSGKRIAVTLIPKDGPSGGGSQLSLAAISELGADMTALLTLEVYR